MNPTLAASLPAMVGVRGQTTTADAPRDVFASGLHPGFSMRQSGKVSGGDGDVSECGRREGW